MIPLCEPNLDGHELAYLTQCVQTNFVSSVGAFVGQFEQNFAAFLGVPHAVAVSNGTAAIHLALVLLGIGPGDEVWVSDFTFAASINPILYLRARPVLVDSELETWNLDPKLVVAELKRRDRLGLPQPKAILAVHIVGSPLQLHEIAQVCWQFHVPLVEDAAEALGARYTTGPLAGRQVGSIGDIGCFSFNGNKIMTTGGGGMLVTADAQLAARAKHLSTQAKEPGYAYFHDEIGYNYRLTNVAAALGVAQLERMDHFLEAKRAIAKRYDTAFADLAGVRLPPRPADTAPTFWLYSLLFADGWLGPLQWLEARGIQSRPLWTALHRMPPYRDCARLGSGLVAEELCDQGLSLPCSVHLTLAQQDEVIAAVRQYVLKS